jgi:hypothetical protein
MKPLEAAAAHLNSISSPFSLDLNILKAGMNDLVKRLEALEANAPPKRP